MEHNEKSILIPSRIQKFLGFNYQTSKMILYLILKKKCFDTEIDGNLGKSQNG